MSKTFWTCAALAALLLFAASAYKACRLYDDLSVVKGAYEEAKRKADADTKLAEQIVKDANEIIAEQSDKIVSLDKQIKDKLSTLKDKDKQLGALGATYAAGHMTDAEKISNLEAQVRAWADKFSLAETIIYNQLEEIKAWEIKYTAQVKISDAWKLRYENEARLHSLCREQVGLLEGRVKTLGLRSKLMSYVALGVGGYLAYDLVKK